MKRNISLAVLMLLALSLSAQTDRYKQRYEMLVSKLGPAGVGVETVLDNWEKADSTDADMLLGRFNYWFTKAQTAEVVSKPDKKYLGMDPILTLKDSTGTDVFYFQEVFYDDQMYGNAVRTIDKAISYHPEMLDFRFVKANAYIAYEKESPDMALAYLLSLIDESMTRKVWLYGNEPTDSKFFSDAILEYCFSFYSIGSDASMNAFLALSERMLQLDKNNPAFLNNVGTYNFVVKHDYKTARKYYDKVLKANPDDYTAIKNSVLMARRQNNVKLEKKYLQMLVTYGPENEKAAAQARLKALEK